MGSLQKTVDSDDSAAINTLNEIKSSGEVSSENCVSDLIRTNESNEIRDNLHKVDESKGDKDNFDCKGSFVPLSLSTIQKVKRGGRITIAKSDTIIETREECSDSETSDIDNSATIHTNKTEDNRSPKCEESVDSINVKIEEKNTTDSNECLNNNLGDIEEQVANEKQFETQSSIDKSLNEPDQISLSDHSNIRAELEVNDLSTHKD